VRTMLPASKAARWWGDAEGTHYAVASLKAIGAEVPSKSSVCSALSKDPAGRACAGSGYGIAVLHSSERPAFDALTPSPPPLVCRSAALEGLYHSISAAELLGCSGIAIGEKHRSALQDGLNSEVLLNILHALKAITASGSGSKTVSVNDFDVTAIPARVIEWMEADTGKFPSTGEADDDDMSAVNTGRALQIFGALFAARHELDNSIADQLRTLSGKIAGIFDVSGTLTRKCQNATCVCPRWNAAVLTRSCAPTARLFPACADLSAGSDVNGLVASSILLQGVNALASSLSEQIDIGTVRCSTAICSMLCHFCLCR
jgi:hypothetical protein